MNLNRKDLLQKLLCVQPGLSKNKSIHQADCVVMRRGRFYTFCREITCSLLSGLDPEIDGAVKAEKIIDLLKSMPDEEVDFTVKDQIVHIKGLNGRGKIPMEDEVVLPLNEVEIPKQWVQLSEGFSEAVDVVHRCTRKKSDFLKECVHVHPEWLEASDDASAIRYNIPTFVSESVLVRATSIKEIVQLGMTKGCETGDWLHFHNPMGLRLSVRKFKLESYPPLHEFLLVKGEKITLPKTLQQAAETAEIFADEDRGIQIKVSKSGMTVEGKSVQGEYAGDCKVTYNGPDLSFMISPKLIAKLVESETKCEITDNGIIVNGGRFVFGAVLEVVR